MRINADYYIPQTKEFIPTGEIAPVASEPVFDLRIPKRLGDVLPHCPGEEYKGYAHNFCINKDFAKFETGCNMR